MGRAQGSEGFRHQACAHVPCVTFEALVPEPASPAFGVRPANSGANVLVIKGSPKSRGGEMRGSPPSSCDFPPLKNAASTRWVSPAPERLRVGEGPRKSRPPEVPLARAVRNGPQRRW